jgi:hypothetical protein
MRMLQRLLVGPLVFTLLVPLDVRAQTRHAVSPSHVAEAIAAHADQAAQDVAEVRDAVSHAEVREIASRLGIDPADLGRSVGLLAGDDLSEAADAARQVNEALVGGQSTVVLSTTTILIVLLIIIVIVAVAD